MCVLGNGGPSCLRSVLCAYFKVCRRIHSFHCQTQQAIQLRLCKEMPTTRAEPAQRAVNAVITLQWTQKREVLCWMVMKHLF